MGSLFSKNCLVAEDEGFMRRVLVVALERLGARVIDCANGREALKALECPQRIDFALLDILMPEMHGLHVLKQIRSGATRQDFDMPVALLTATREEACVHYAGDLSCDGFILKPVTQSSLSQRVEQMLFKRMVLPYRPTHYGAIDVGPPDEPPRFYRPDASAKASGLRVNDFLIGMVFTAPLSSEGKVIVPPGTPVTVELLVLLKNLDRVKSLGVVDATIP